MNIKEIGEFYKEFVMSEEFAEKLQDKLRHIHSEQEYREFISEFVLPVAKEKGYNFSVDDILWYEKIILNSLSEDDLADVAGGRPNASGKNRFVPGLMLFVKKFM